MISNNKLKHKLEQFEIHQHRNHTLVLLEINSISSSREEEGQTIIKTKFSSHRVRYKTRSERLLCVVHHGINL